MPTAREGKRRDRNAMPTVRKGKAPRQKRKANRARVQQFRIAPPFPRRSPVRSPARTIACAGAKSGRHKRRAG